MAIGVDDISFVTGNGSSNTLSHDSGGSDRALAVLLSFYSPSSEVVSGITYAAVALSSVGNAEDGAGERAEMWKLSAPASGTNNLVTTFSGTVSFVLGAISLTGAEQTTASLTRTPATTTGNGTAPSVNATSQSGDMVIDCLSQFAATDTVGAGQTERWNANTADIHGAASTEPATGTSTTMSWSLGSAADFALIAAAFIPSVSGGTVYTRTLSDAINVSDLTGTARQRNRFVFDGIDITDLSGGLGFAIYHRSLTDVMAVTDATASYTQRNRIIADAVDANDAAQREAMIYRRVAESVAVNDAIARTIIEGGVTIVTRTLRDNIDLADACARAATLYRLSLDSVTAADDLRRYAERNRFCVETLTVAEQVARSLIRNRVLRDPVEASDTAVRFALLQRLLTDGVAVEDSLTELLTYYQQFIGFVLMALESTEFVAMRLDPAQPVEVSLTATQHIVLTLGAE